VIGNKFPPSLCVCLLFCGAIEPLIKLVLGGSIFPARTYRALRCLGALGHPRSDSPDGRGALSEGLHIWGRLDREMISDDGFLFSTITAPNSSFVVLLSTGSLAVGWEGLALLLVLAFIVNPSDVILHVVHAGKDAATLFALGPAPLALDPRVVLCFVPRAILFAAEPARQRLVVGSRASGGGGLALRASFDAAEQVLAVSIVMLP